MSYNILKSVAVISFGAIVGYSSVKFLLNPSQNSRAIASFPISKVGQEQNSRYLFNIKINTEELAKTEEGVSTIKINIEALKKLNAGLSYSWILAQDIELLEGSLNGDLGEFTENQNKEFILKVRGFSKQLKKFISFEVNGEFEKKPIRREVLISSRIEDSLEYAIQQNELSKSKNQINKLDHSKSKNKFSPENIIR
ncbi:MAG: hypothetical protein AABY53_05240 [Bdellovibrionota bacterium]